MARPCLRILSVVAICLIAACRRGETFDASLSDALLFDAEPSKLAEILKVQFYLLGEKNRWPTPEELRRSPVAYEALNADEIAEWVKTIRSHGDGKPSARPRQVNAMLVILKDGRTAFFQVLTFDDVAYIIPFPAKNEFGTHGYYSKALFELLRVKGIT